MVLLKNVSPPSEGIHYQQAETMDVLDGKGLFYMQYLRTHKEHLYVMVNCKLNDLQSTMSEKTNDDEGEEEEDDSDPISKIRFVPSDKTALELLFSAMCECQYDVEKAQQGHGEEDLHLNSVCDHQVLGHHPKGKFTRPANPATGKQELVRPYQPQEMGSSFHL
uniref:Methylosome subunit pICln n=1 Tax=Erpetoichthys calabaricus TaxID=27687 RepID=A0A8C4RFM3_ERPCA